MFWALENRDAAGKMSARAQIELPPVGYAGSLAGTEWDDDQILRDYA